MTKQQLQQQQHIPAGKEGEDNLVNLPPEKKIHPYANIVATAA